MARGVNKVILVGNLGADPDMRFMDNGTAITHVSIATSEIWKDSQTGEAREKTEWHRVTAFGKLAEIIAKYCQKGSKIYIEGRLKTNKWQEQSGQDRYTTSVIADQMQILGGGAPSGKNIAPPVAPSTETAQQHSYDYAEASGSRGRKKTPPQTSPIAEDFLDGDMPF